MILTVRGLILSFIGSSTRAPLDSWRRSRAALFGRTAIRAVFRSLGASDALAVDDHRLCAESQQNFGCAPRRQTNDRGERIGNQATRCDDGDALLPTHCGVSSRIDQWIGAIAIFAALGKAAAGACDRRVCESAKRK